MGFGFGFGSTTHGQSYAVVDDPPHTLRYEIEYFRDFGIHALGDDFEILRQVREEVLLSQSGYGQR